METERLILRKVNKSDAEDIYSYSKEPNVGPNAGWSPHKTLEETKGIISTMFLDKDVFAIVLKETGKVIGTLGFTNDPKRENPQARMLGYAISQKYWGRGFMTEAVKAVIEYAFEILNIDIISAYCYPHNTRSKRVLEKCSFTYEGTLKKAEKLFDGRVLDNDCYSLERLQ